MRSLLWLSIPQTSAKSTNDVALLSKRQSTECKQWPYCFPLPEYFFTLSSIQLSAPTNCASSFFIFFFHSYFVATETPFSSCDQSSNFQQLDHPSQLHNSATAIDKYCSYSLGLYLKSFVNNTFYFQSFLNLARSL